MVRDHIGDQNDYAWIWSYQKVLAKNQLFDLLAAYQITLLRRG